MKKNKQLKKSFLLLLGFCFAFTLNAQQKTIKGVVTSGADGMALPGVNVIVKGTNTGTSTNFDGNYSINISGDNASLVFSYIGYLTKEVSVGSAGTINVILEEDLAALEEIVVVGYGARRKSDITGSVSSVTSDELNAFPVLDATQALQGRAAGVVVQSNNGGEPGAPINIKVRGNASIGANSAPLIVVDGFVGASMPQANDIASIEVLKDASATAIYGSRGSGGVILVTTKKGKNGKLSVELNTTYSVQNTANELDLLNADQFATYQQMINPAYVQGTENTDWQDIIYRTGSVQNHQFSFSGGSDKINFYASANYFQQDGIIINSDFEKITFLSNIDAQVTDKLKLGMNLFSSRGVQNGVLTQSTGSDPIGNVNGGGDDVVSLAFRFTPDRGIFDDDGNFTQNSVGDGIENPYAVANELVNETKTDNSRTNLYANYDILQDLSFKTTFGFSTLNETIGYFKPQTFQLSTGGASLSNRRRTNILSENYLTYNKEIGKGALTLLAGYSYQKTSTERFSASTQELLTDDFSYWNLIAGHIETRIVTSSLIETEIISQFGRINYDFDDKYLLTATVRRDGSSNFAENEKYAIFPSGALGWKVSNEDFLKDNDVISNLKLRASYGVTGNQGITPYQSLAALQVTPPTAPGTDSTVSVFQEDNPDLKWESSYQTNIGVDLSLLNSKISLSLDYYNIDTKDLLLQATTIPVYVGATNLQVFQNIGEVNNKGFEISLNTRNISNDNFTWTTDFNLSTNKNKIVKLINGVDIIASAAPGYFAGKNTYILREGEAVGLFWGHEYRGVYQGGDLPAGTAILDGAEAGDPLFTDVADEDGNFDGVINTDDEKIIGDPNPDFTFGFTNNFSYKNFDLSLFFQGAVGGDILNLTNVQLFNGDSNSVTDVLNSWTPTNTDTNIPRAVASRGREISTRFIEDGSYVRLKNIALGYNFQSDVVKKLGMSSLRLSVSAQNLLTFTNYSGLDPEVSYFGNGGSTSGKANVVQGHDFGNYPTVRSVSFNLNLKF
ncbi:SusC/RagA family TonB-linked outer membrane protein [Flavivirga jejuensis]|uniref:TonB-dependent receptor n=1 Tax=Flavivirga jejuensis TaxID=870487 RepID=A0ABT8WJT6_9FLAO|nr:TonB-dependent receptor [Flavivirga jejuensis]MDO5973414.1 TonB-dependent receptor [Flavivirga jejuensis]